MPRPLRGVRSRRSPRPRRRRYAIVIRVRSGPEEVAVVGDKERVLELVADHDVRPERQTLELRGNILGINAGSHQGRNEVEETGLHHREGQEVRAALLIAYVRGAVEIDVVEGLRNGRGIVAQAFAVALIQQEFVAVYSSYKATVRRWL